MIGPALPPHLVAQRSTTSEEEGNETGPSLPPIGPEIPAGVPGPSQPTARTNYEEDEGDEDDYVPALPPDLAAARAPHSEPAASSKRVRGPALLPALREQHVGAHDDEDGDEDDYGPMPLPGGVSVDESDGVREFLEKEERRRKQVEEASKPKALKREEWMLVPPSSSDLLGSIDPTKLTKPRQFSRSTAPPREVDTSLWTETPAERQQRLADEVAGKRRRATNADPDIGDESTELEARKRRRRDEEIRRGVDEYTRKNRGDLLIEQHAEKAAKEAKRKADEDEAPVIWDHSRDMAISGRLMDDKSRDKFVREARGLADRFGTGKSGGFL